MSLLYLFICLFVVIYRLSDRLALQHEHDEIIPIIEDTSNTVDLSSPISTSSNLVELSENTTNQPTIDLGLFILPDSPTKCRLTLSPGDWIGYEDKVIHYFFYFSDDIFISQFIYTFYLLKQYFRSLKLQKLLKL